MECTAKLSNALRPQHILGAFCCLNQPNDQRCYLGPLMGPCASGTDGVCLCRFNGGGGSIFNVVLIRMVESHTTQRITFPNVGFIINSARRLLVGKSIPKEAQNLDVMSE